MCVDRNNIDCVDKLNPCHEIDMQAEFEITEITAVFFMPILSPKMH